MISCHDLIKHLVYGSDIVADMARFRAHGDHLPLLVPNTGPKHPVIIHSVNCPGKIVFVFVFVTEQMLHVRHWPNLPDQLRLVAISTEA